MQWLWISVVASVVLTVVANVVVRLLPRRPAEPRFDPYQRWGEASGRSTPPPGWDDDQPRIRVVAPWKAMLIVSIVATLVLDVALNLVLAVTR
ncbi:hypothetical protein [Dermatobacter hominis]|uniref:hypothetical protein n=1 Tax=Dermatobacter hominis TaxID=2884263 RepID=UPI001D12920B|nr:hypothetical protein [Dermatobacter hominis]UDY34795.1 hypothetical protein LH044_15810 [Dermatobacter hominis]